MATFLGKVSLENARIKVNQALHCMKIPPLNGLKMVSVKRNRRKQESFLFVLFAIRNIFRAQVSFHVISLSNITNSL